MQDGSEARRIKSERGITLFAIAAVSTNNCIGKGNSLPWKLPSDLKRFKKLTTGSAVIMGRATYESIGRPLPGRTMIVITSDPSYKAEGCLVANTIEEAIKHCPENKTSWVIGGSKVYRQLMDLCEVAHITEVKTEVLDGDAFFPYLNRSIGWRLITETHWEKQDGDEFSTRYMVWGQMPEIFRKCGFDIYGKANT